MAFLSKPFDEGALLDVSSGVRTKSARAGRAIARVGRLTYRIHTTCHASPIVSKSAPMRVVAPVL